jgi:hypothetical protein
MAESYVVQKLQRRSPPEIPTIVGHSRMLLDCGMLWFLYCCVCVCVLQCSLHVCKLLLKLHQLLLRAGQQLCHVVHLSLQLCYLR